MSEKIICTEIIIMLEIILNKRQVFDLLVL